jgi:DNA-binding NtrC family response regulator
MDRDLQPTFTQPTVLVATVDSAIRQSMQELLQMYPLKTIWAKAVDEVKNVLASESVAACFCGFWLVDGTYRDVVRHLKRQPVEIPAIIVCAPACPHEYRDYLAALNIRAFDFICHPYRRADLERILRAAITGRRPSAPFQSPVGIPVNDVENRSGLRKAG